MADHTFDATADATKAQVGSGRQRLRSIHSQELDSAVGYIQLFDKAVGDVTVGTTTPDMVIPLGADGALNVVWGDDGPTFMTGLTYAVTTTPTGSTDPTTPVPLTIVHD